MAVAKEVVDKRVAALVVMHALPQWKASAVGLDASFMFNLVIEESAMVIGRNEVEFSRGGSRRERRVKE
ncbi:hypothetical protein PMAA_093110 [Talaromyces marneffei ATCC 18224]|uniref:Uncharacterized protein n=1 Tax=Talaromyces marneffei (strain ATCC 18224 / CBS 334.59 / QM 7333) TaxID=441960 RepID=B6QH47_TALMQ|nr:hypothetical protein PMAA_093110 [Talaromyces marneffei ATCC 18224]